MRKNHALHALAICSALLFSICSAQAYDPFDDKPVDPTVTSSGDKSTFNPPVAGESLKIVTFSSGALAGLDTKFNEWT